MRKFEYKTMTIDMKNNNAEIMDSTFNTLGEEGWEIVDVITNDAAAALFIFKKEKSREFADRPLRERSKRPFDSKPRGGEFNPKARDMKPRSDNKPWVNDAKSDRRPKRF